MYAERTMIDRLTRTFHAASPEAHASADWYADVMGRDVLSIAQTASLPFHTVAAVMAVLSPGPTYAQNVKDTRAVIDAAQSGSDVPSNVTAYGANVRKALAILAELPSVEDIDPFLGKVGGAPKVRAFYANAMGDWSRVTLDRHAIRPISKSGQDVPTCKAERARMEDAYRKAAARVGLAPAQFQAVVWCAVRGTGE